MTPFILGLAVLLMLLWVAGCFKRADAHKAALGFEKILSWIILAAALYFLATGRWFVALFLLPLFLSAVGLHILWNPFLPSLSAPRFRSRYLDLAATMGGKFQARVREGRHKGRDLKSFDEAGLLALFDEFADDAESCALLAAYLDRRFPHWREHAQAHFHAGQGRARAAQGVVDVLTEQEAYEILGLQKGATLEKIGEAHRRLMKRFHPDIGGSTWFAAKLNAAKDLLVKTHYRTPDK